MKNENPLDQSYDIIMGAVAAWKEQHTPEVLAAQVEKMLDGKLRDMTMILMGFSNSWGRWEVDRTNGYDTSTPIGTYLREHIRDTMVRLISKVKLRTFNKQQVENLQKYYNERLEQSVKSQLRDLAEQQAKEIAKEIMEKATEPVRAKAAIQMMKLVEGS